MNYRVLLTAALCALLIAPLAAQTKRPMTFADLQAMKRVSDPQISPSGKWVLFSVTDVTLAKNSKVNHLWAVPLDGKASAAANGNTEHEITTGSGETNGRFSPDGKWVSYTSSEGGKSEIWIAPWDESDGTVGKGHAVTTLETEADGAIWASDSKHFVFTSEVYPDCESMAPTMEARAEEEEDCNTTRDNAEAKNPVKAQVFTSLLYRHWDHYQGEKRSHIFYASIDARGDNRTPRDMTPRSVIGNHVAPTFFLGAPLGYAISPDGDQIAYVVNLDPSPAESTNNDIYVVQVGAEPRFATKKVSTSPGSDDGPQYSPDSKYLAWRSQARNGYESDKFDLVVMDRSHPERSGSIVPRMTNSKNEPISDNWIDEFAWSPDSKSIAVARPDRGKEVVQVIALPVWGKLEKLGEDWSADAGELGSLFVAKDGSVVAIQMFVNRPAEVVLLKHSLTGPDGGDIRISNTDIKQITHLNDPLIGQLYLAPLEPFWFPGANGTQVEGFLVKPPNFDPSKKYPVKLLIHGGPQGAWGDAWSYRWNPELFAADGYVVVMINQRGSTGYGQKFLEEVSGDWGGRPYIDLMKGLDYAEQHFSFIDKDRECALGASYGGFMANWVLTHTNRFKCIVTHDGMYNPQSAFGTTEEDWFNEWEFRPLATKPGAPKSPGGPSVTASPSRVGSSDSGANADAVVEQDRPAHPWDFYDKPASQDPFRKFSPMLSIKNARTPTLVIHGQRDYRLDVSEGLQLFDSLQMLHVPSKMIYFENEGHWVLKPKDSEFWYQQVNDWCDRWLGMGQYKRIGPEKNPMAASEKK